MSRFIAVSHYWFMDSKGFSVERIDADNLDDAKMKAALMQINKDSKFKRCAVEVVEIGSDEIVLSRKLTIRERLTGKISSSQAGGK